MGSSTGRPTVVSILGGSGRSGSSLMGQALGTAPSAIYVGELLHLWVFGLQQGGTCSCGSLIRDCSFWSSVLDKLRSDGHDFQAIADEVGRLPSIKRIKLPRRIGSRAPNLAAVIPALHSTIAETASVPTVVEASKYPAYISVMLEVGQLDTAIKLVRDPRAVAFSWSQSKTFVHANGAEYSIATQPAWKASMSWILHEVHHAALARRSPNVILCLYEDLSRQPGTVLQHVADQIGLGSLAVDGATLLAPSTHAVAGNPSSRRTGTIHIRTDERWATDMPSRQKLLATALTAPWLARYGYARPMTRPPAKPFNWARGDKPRAKE